MRNPLNVPFEATIALWLFAIGAAVVAPLAAVTVLLRRLPDDDLLDTVD